MFIDRAKIEVRSGKGGDGAIAFLREKYVAKGGPAGGNGGRGGSIIITADSSINTLINYRHSRVITAQDGEKGGIKNQYGRAASDVEVFVPVGTVIKDLETGNVLFDLDENKKSAVVAKGGRGGRGNACFKSATNRVPKVAENGLPGETKKLILELKLIADVGLVGFPSVGKSTLLSVVSEAKPAIADYPFTTLTPNLGVVSYSHFESFVMADLPGLIEGAHEGKGLGLEFLRHVERCRVIVHVVSMSGERDPLVDYSTINKELESYDLDLLSRPTIIVASKMDEDGAYDRLEAFKKAINKDVIGISALTHEGIDELISKCVQYLSEAPKPSIKEIKEEKVKVYDASKEAAFNIVLEKPHIWRITGDTVLRTYSLINISTDEGLMKLLAYLRKIGVDEALDKMDIEEGDTVYLGDFAFEYIR